MAQRAEPEEKDWKRSAAEAFLALRLDGFKFSIMETRKDLGAKLQATRCENKRVTARATVSCECVSDKILRVEVHLSEEGQRDKHLEVILKDDCNCRQFQVLERRNQRVVMSRVGDLPL